MKGVVKWFNNEKGFGFVQSGCKDYFVHYKEILTGGFKSLKDGQEVEFEPAESAKGPVAKAVKVF